MHLAYHDALTGLPNRMLFNDRLSVALTQAKRSRSRLALMLLDLDRFKEINDTFGHTVGDELLRRTGDRVRQLLRTADTVARMGGDEFMLLLPEISQPQDAASIAHKVLDAIRQPIQLDGRSVTVLASIGTVVYPDDGEDSDTLMRRADQAMYRAKAEGGDRHNGCGSAGRASSAGSSRIHDVAVNDRVSQ
jgi:diguanylate cyclase (GGDEF)-like protein